MLRHHCILVVQRYLVVVCQAAISTTQAQRPGPPPSDYGVTSPRDAWIATSSSRRSQTKAEARGPALQRMARIKLAMAETRTTTPPVAVT